MSKKKKFLVSLAVPESRIAGINVPGKGTRKFSKMGSSFLLSDAGEAKEISREMGRTVAVSEIPNYKAPEDSGHKYSFAVRKGNESRAKRQKRLERDGWVEKSPGRWVKVGTS